MFTGRQAIGFTLLVLLVLATSTGFAIAAADCRQWRQIREMAEGTVFHRCRPGSPVDEVMIETQFLAAPERLYALVNDYDTFAGFIPDVAESRVLEAVGTVQWVFHRLHFPGPVADRTYVMQSRGDVTGTPPAAWRVEWALSDRDFPQVDLSAGVRPDSLSGFWEIAAAGHPKVTKARYAVHSDPGGHVPVWLVMRLTDRYVQQVVAAIRRRIED
ncbi:MAG TPA: SRPBCC family protein [Gammaproteobacteria bacterium]|nr:SRPBCC family protein [Gammaproteobacteria bacterium]